MIGVKDKHAVLTIEDPTARKREDTFFSMSSILMGGGGGPRMIQLHVCMGCVVGLVRASSLTLKRRRALTELVSSRRPAEPAMEVDDDEDDPD